MVGRVSWMIVCVAAAVTAQAQEAGIGGRVLDRAGEPVEGASVAALWSKGRPAGGVTTDGEGRFRIELRSYSRPAAILVMDRERQRGAVSRYEPSEFEEVRDLQLEKLVKIQGKFTSRELGEQPTWTNVYLNLLPGKIRIGKHDSKEAKFSFLVPPGEYELYMYGTDVKKKTIRRTILGDEGTIDLKTIDLEATEVAKMYGKPPPRLSVSDARGVEKRVQLSDFKGRYVLLEFWGFW